MLSLLQGKKLVQSARKAVVSKLEGKHFELEGYEKQAGIFVTIHNYPGNELRGCIGFPEPVFPLNKALTKAALAAAFSDPRFRPVQKDELDKIIFEVSLLSNPELIKVEKPEDYRKEIKIGRDGLIVEQNAFRGLLLPQVAIEWGWNIEEFLNHTCEKAGIPSEAWKDVKSSSIYKFQSQIFKETEPNKKIIESKGF